MRNNIDTFKRYFKRDGFIFNVSALMAGNISAQAIGFLLTPLITRLYLPADFGMLSLLMSIIGVLSVISCLRYETVIVLPKSYEDGLNIFSLCILNAFIYSILLSVVVMFFGDQIRYTTKVEGLSQLLWIIPIGVLIKGLHLSFRYWFARHKKFTTLSKAQVAMPIATAIIKITAALLVGSSAIWLIFGNLTGILVFSIILASLSVKKIVNDIPRYVSFKKMKRIAFHYKEFPTYNLATALLNALSKNLPFMLLAYYFSKDIVGYYGLCAAMLSKPQMLISNSVRNVFLQKAAELNNLGKSTRDAYVKTITSLFLIGIIPFGIVTFFGPTIFSIVFGEKWIKAGEFAQLIAPWLFLMFVNPPATQIIIVQRKLKFYLIFDIFLLIFRLLAIRLGIFLSPNPLISIGLFSLVGFIANLYLIIYAFIISDKSLEGSSHALRQKP